MRLTAPQPSVRVISARASRGGSPAVRTTWVSMTPRTALSGTLSVVAVATSSRPVRSSAWSSAWAMTSLLG